MELNFQRCAPDNNIEFPKVIKPIWRISIRTVNVLNSIFFFSHYAFNSCLVNPLLNNKIIDMTKMKAFVVWEMVKMKIHLVDRV